RRPPARDAGNQTYISLSLCSTGASQVPCTQPNTLYCLVPSHVLLYWLHVTNIKHRR
uniref:Uncharacterized protein n=1 Tax=Oryza brachyantha TaxID=4533 RepID=J3M7M8_ORYBR